VAFEDVGILPESAADQSDGSCIGDARVGFRNQSASCKPHFLLLNQVTDVMEDIETWQSKMRVFRKCGIRSPEIRIPWTGPRSRLLRAESGGSGEGRWIWRRTVL
jgi:hypothetical protein